VAQLELSVTSTRASSAAGVAIEVVRNAAPNIRDMAVGETVRQLSRRSI